MSVSEAKRRSNAKWDKENISRLSVVFRKEECKKVKAAAAALKIPVNWYIVESVNQRMDRDAVSNRAVDPPSNVGGGETE